MYENIGDNLHYLRYTRTPFYSQREVAQKLHVSKSTYARYEKGDLIPPLWFLHGSIDKVMPIPLFSLLLYCEALLFRVQNDA